MLALRALLLLILVLILVATLPGCPPSAPSHVVAAPGSPHRHTAAVP